MNAFSKISILATLLIVTSACVVNHTSKPDDSTAIERHYFNDWETEIGYAQAVRDGNILYVSGIPAGGKDMPEAMQKAYQRISDVLAKFGATPDHITKEVIFTTDMEATKAAISVRRAFFSEGSYPAATWVQIERLYNPELLLEVDVTVTLPN